MSRLDPTDIQGIVLRGYTFPFTRYLLVEITAMRGREFILKLIDQITTGEHWDHGKPRTTMNVAFTYKGLAKLEVPEPSLQSFPIEFVQGMKARGPILCDVERNAPDHWEPVWRDDLVDALLGVYAESLPELEQQCAQLLQLMTVTDAARLLGWQDAAALVVDGKVTTKEHFGFTDGFGNPDYIGVRRDTQPGQGNYRSRASGYRSPRASSCSATPTKQVSCPSRLSLISSRITALSWCIENSIRTFRNSETTWTQKGNSTATRRNLRRSSSEGGAMALPLSCPPTLPALKSLGISRET